MARLFIIAGHGAGDSGAVGYGYTEAERVRALAKKIKKYGGDNVMVGDTSKNWYASNLISSLSIPSDYQIVELHMDSNVNASAHGGHVIIYGALKADDYDTALANYISSEFPGRSNVLVGRTDLANPRRASARGYGYRLLECGFISNEGDLDHFNDNLDDIAKGILEVFSVEASNSPFVPVASTPSGTEVLEEDGKIGEASCRVTQKFFGTKQDGYISGQPKGNAKYLPNVFCIEYGSGGSDVITAWQVWLRNKGYYQGYKIDGLIGKGTVIAIQEFLRDQGLYTGKIDGSFGYLTAIAWQRYLNTH